MCTVKTPPHFEGGVVHVHRPAAAFSWIACSYLAQSTFPRPSRPGTRNPGTYYHRAGFAKSLLLDFLTGTSPLFRNI